jgi:hypothetical protein
MCKAGVKTVCLCLLMAQCSDELVKKPKNIQEKSKKKKGEVRTYMEEMLHFLRGLASSTDVLPLVQQPKEHRIRSKLHLLP